MLLVCTALLCMDCAIAAPSDPLKPSRLSDFTSSGFEECVGPLVLAMLCCPAGIGVPFPAEEYVPPAVFSIDQGVMFTTDCIAKVWGGSRMGKMFFLVSKNFLQSSSSEFTPYLYPIDQWLIISHIRNNSGCWTSGVNSVFGYSQANNSKALSSHSWPSAEKVSAGGGYPVRQYPRFDSKSNTACG